MPTFIGAISIALGPGYTDRADLLAVERDASESFIATIGSSSFVDRGNGNFKLSKVFNIADGSYHTVQPYQASNTSNTFPVSIVTPDSSSPGTIAGAGADAVTMTFTNSTNSMPIADADVWVTTDAAGTNVVAGTLQTNSLGKATFLLDAGLTYYSWLQKDGVNSIQGDLFVAVAD